MERNWLKGAKSAYDVVVIGSGLAGMTAANLLGQTGALSPSRGTPLQYGWDWPLGLNAKVAIFWIYPFMVFLPV